MLAQNNVSGKEPLLNLNSVFYLDIRGCHFTSCVHTFWIFELHIIYIKTPISCCAMMLVILVVHIKRKGNKYVDVRTVSYTHLTLPTNREV